MPTYNYKTLYEFCNLHKIILNDNYENQKINRETKISGKCITLNCQNDFNISFRTLLENNCYCKDCRIKLTNDKRRETFIEKYGVSTNLLFNDTIEKRKNNYIENKNEIRNKYNETIQEKYGTNNISQNENIKIKKKEKHKNKTIEQKNDIIEKRKNTNLLIYNSTSPLHNNLIKEKILLTNLNKYGTENPMHNDEIAEKQQKNSYKLKEFKYPSGKIIYFQGYENRALNDLLNLNIDENDIITSRKDVPEIYYIDENNIKHRHYVDIYVKSLNKCIEVKSTWTYNVNKDKVIVKQLTCKKLGYLYEIWIYDKKGNKEIII
jgi:hypothetical protein